MQAMERKLKHVAKELQFTYKFIDGRIKVNQRRMKIISDILKKRDFDIHRASILEVGSYIGFGLISAKTTKYSCGVEYHFENCQRAKYIADVFEMGKISFIRGTAAALPFIPDSFDYIQSHHVIEHMQPDEWVNYISELARVLKPEGVCLMSFPHRHYPIENHYGLPFLHWIPKKYRPIYAKFTTRRHHIRNAEKAYEAVASGKEDLIFTEFPTIKQVREIVKGCFSRNEDITREFTCHPLIKKRLGPIKHKLALLLTSTWICPERKLLLYK